MIDRFTSTKLWVCLIGMLIGSFLRWRGIITDDAWVTVMVTGMVGYPISRVAQKAVEGKKAE